MSKRILVHGSIAIDYIMGFEDNIFNYVVVNSENKDFGMAGAIMPSSKKMQFGGTAGNISYNLGLLNAPCEVITSVGQDFDSTSYRKKFQKFSNIKLNLHEYPNGFCANCYIVNDKKNQQLIIFHGGVTQNLPEKTLGEMGINSENTCWGINSPENMIQMTRISEQLKNLGINVIMDTGQVTPAFSGEQLLKMIHESKIMIGNENEISSILEKTGLNEESILKEIPVVIKTNGKNGSFIITQEGVKHIPIVNPIKVADPTGAGDGYRAGLLTALQQGLSIEEGCKIGATVSSFVIETVGGQTHSFSNTQFKKRFEKSFGEFKLKF